MVLTVIILLTGLLAWVGLELWLRSRQRRRSMATTPSSKGPLEWVNLALGILLGLAWMAVFFLGAQRWPVAAILLVAALALLRWFYAVRS